MEEKRLFCPDTHFLVAYCFYDDFEVPYLNRQEKKQRRIYEEIRKTGKMITFPCHRSDFDNKLWRTQLFFRDIVLCAKRKSKNRKEFKNEIFRLMKNNFVWESFERFIHVKLPYFSQFVTFDETSFFDAFYKETRKYLIRFNEEVSDIQFNLDDNSPLVIREYDILKGWRQAMNSPQDRDLKLFATCVVYCREYLAEGILYLATEDRDFRKFAKSILDKNLYQRFSVLSANDFLGLIR